MDKKQTLKKDILKIYIFIAAIICGLIGYSTCVNSNEDKSRLSSQDHINSDISINHSRENSVSPKSNITYHEAYKNIDFETAHNILNNITMIFRHKIASIYMVFLT